MICSFDEFLSRNDCQSLTQSLLISPDTETRISQQKLSKLEEIIGEVYVIDTTYVFIKYYHGDGFFLEKFQYWTFRH